MSGIQVQRLRAAWPGLLVAAVIAAMALALMTMTAHAAEEDFTSPGADTFTVPAGVTSILVEVWGAGGGGGGAGGDGDDGGSGGGGGGGYVRTTVAVTPGQVYDIIVGQGGAGGGDAEDGEAGGNSNFSGHDLTITAEGGAGGGNGAAASGGGAGGAGRNGNALALVGVLTDTVGAQGGDGADGNASDGGGGGGGAGFGPVTPADGADGNNQVGGNGGGIGPRAGGAAGAGGISNGDGGDAGSPGGGGGGSGQGGHGGNGGHGRVLISWEAPGATPTPPGGECTVPAGTFNPALAPFGLTIAIWGGGNVSELPDAVSYWTTHEGGLIGYIPGAPAFVNEGFLDEFTAELPACMGFIVRT